MTTVMFIKVLPSLVHLYRVHNLIVGTESDKFSFFDPFVALFLVNNGSSYLGSINNT